MHIVEKINGGKNCVFNLSIWLHGCVFVTFKKIIPSNLGKCNVWFGKWVELVFT
jgi:hypothetical protein